MSRLPPPVAEVRGALRTFLAERLDTGDLRPGDLVLAACSGGADSVALASQLGFLAPRMGVRGGLVTVDHQMQPGSGEQAEQVVAVGAELGLDPVVIAPAGADHREGGGGPETTAREVRYAALARAREQHGARAVLLAHTMEDQAETVLLGLARGAGTRAAAGMAPQRGRYWRPLLAVRRAHTEAACRELDLPVWQDPTNRADGPWRTAAGEALPRAALRHRVLPELSRALGQDVIPALARTGGLLREDADLLEALTREHAHLIDVPGTGAPEAVPGAVAAADVDALAELAPPLRRRVLRELLLAAGAPEGQVNLGHARAVEALVTAWRGQRGISVPGGLRAVRSCGRLYIVTPTPQERT